MKRHFRDIVALILLLPCFMGCAESSLSEPGVSKDLAVYRRQYIDSLRYALSFSIPSEKDSPVTGSVEVRFYLRQRGTLWLDFRAGGNVLSLNINGHEVCDPVCNDEHIALPRHYLRRGCNEVVVAFVSEDQSLNRNEDYLYTLLVPDRARTLFPCFDQPDLKARYTLTLEIPEEWKAVSNTSIVDETSCNGRHVVLFAETEPLSTYLFSFVTGMFDTAAHTDDHGRTIGVYYREKDPARLAQLPVLFSWVERSLQWLETYTGIPYPFAKYDFIILPGFQYGGMEHTGATLYNDSRVFLSDGAGLSEELGRAQLIAHETAHMWFGDLVTMKWFDDVWTKEVFANYYAAEITRDLLPEADHNAVWQHTYVSAAMSQDRTEGRTAIQQSLDNLAHAGLVYNNIIYNKAPIVMKKLVELMGKDAFREGIREYLHTYAYGNASWDDLIAILARHCTADVAEFSSAWVKEKGLPSLLVERHGDTLCVSNIDLSGKGIVWPQSFEMTVGNEAFEVALTSTPWTQVVPGLDSLSIVPNTDGRAYGWVLPEVRDLQELLCTWRYTPNAEAALMLLHENFLLGRIDMPTWCHHLLDAIEVENDPLLADLLVGYLREPLLMLADTLDVEQRLLTMCRCHPSRSIQLRIGMLLASYGREAATHDAIYALWAEGFFPDTYAMSVSWNLAICMPACAADILMAQRARLTSADRLRQFDFISRACSSDTAQLDSLFYTLALPENRRIEPWTQTLLALLNHPLREQQSAKYIVPALEWLPDIHRTGDIFFPAGWCNALLSTHTSPEAYDALCRYLSSHADLPEMLLSKIRTASFLLERTGGADLMMDQDPINR